MTPNEERHVRAVGEKLESIKALLNEATLSATAPMGEWLICLRAMKEIAGNSHNDMNTIACLMTKDYLRHKLSMRDYDAMAKAHGAGGFDIDEQTADGQRVIAEIKTTGAFGLKDIRQPQRKAILDDLDGLCAAEARHKFFFVVDPEIFAIIKRKHFSHLPGMTLVLVSTGEEFIVGQH